MSFVNAGTISSMQKAISNVLDNAIEYAGAGCEVTVRVCRMNDVVRIVISGNGPGSPRLFGATCSTGSSGPRIKVPGAVSAYRSSGKSSYATKETSRCNRWNPIDLLLS